MALDRGALSENNRQTCQNIRQELTDAISAYHSAEIDYTGHRNSIRQTEKEIRNLENQLRNASENERARLQSEISEQQNRLDFYNSAVNQLTSYLSNYENQIYQLNNDFQNSACHQFFQNPADNFNPFPTS